jgi:hypothetical protein
MRAAIVGVAGFAALIVLGALALGGGRAGVSAALGGGLATLNLWVLAQIVRGVVGGKGPIWGVLGFLKLGALLVAVWLLLALPFVQTLPFVLGLCALPLGITAASLVPRDKDGPRDA